MIKNVKVIGIVLILSSVVIAVVAVFCWNKSDYFLVSPEIKQAQKEKDSLSEEYEEKVNSALFFMGLTGRQPPESLKEEIDSLGKKMNKQQEIIEKQIEKSSDYKKKSISSIVCSAGFLIVGIIITIIGQKKTKNSIFEKCVLDENVIGEEENV